MSAPITPQVSPINALKEVLNKQSVQEQFKNAMANNAPLFIASLIDVVSSDNRLKECDPNDIVREALKAATLKLPINKGLGFAWLIPRKERGRMRPVFQIGYKGYIQLALRTGAYKYINAGPVYEGELVSQEKLTGEIDLSGEKKSETIIGYFAHIETLNGFRKTVYGTVEGITAHAKKFSQSYGKDYSAWTTNFDAMATKTMLTAVLSKYGVMSVEMIAALEVDEDTHEAPPTADDGGGEVIDIKADDAQASTRECPDRDGDRMKESFCQNECKNRAGCPAWDDEKESDQADPSLPAMEF